MKIWKRMACAVLAVCMAAAMAVVPNMDALAAANTKKPGVESKNIEIQTGSPYTNSIVIIYGKGDAQIKNIKSSSKNLYARQTDQDYNVYENTYSEYPYGRAEIGLYAKKSGSYKVSFDVCDINGKRRAKYTVKVKANETYEGDSPVKKVTYAGKQDLWYTLTGKKSGKFKVTMNSGYKLKSITMEYTDANGNSVEKKIKNNKKVTLGKFVYKYEHENSYNDYWSGKKYSNYNLSTSLFATTTFRIKYQNKKTKANGEMSYSLYTLPVN